MAETPGTRTPLTFGKVPYLCKIWHLGPIRIVWHLARYHDIKVAAPGFSCILNRDSLRQQSPGAVSAAWEEPIF